jgi:hypothetical protein
MLIAPIRDDANPSSPRILHPAEGASPKGRCNMARAGHCCHQKGQIA